MSDMFPSDWVEDTYFGGLISPNEVFWQDANRLGLFGLDVPMTKAETIMRREEALKMRWPLIEIIPGAIVPQDPTPIVPFNSVRPRYSELLFGGSPSGSMVDTFCSGLHPIDWSDGWPA